MMTQKSMLKGLGVGLGLLLLSGINANAQVTDAGWRQLFNGKDLNGWKQVGKGTRMLRTA